jgi:hypothetical protein
MTDLELARSEHTSQSELLRLLENSTPAVCRAVASNLNAGPEVLKKASVLNYLGVVLKNRSFHHHALFSDDPWIKATYKVYKNPLLGINSDSAIYQEYGNWPWSKQKHFFALLRILSPNLDLDSLDHAVRNVSSMDFKKALKDKAVKEKIICLCYEALNDESVVYPFNLTSLLKLYSSGLIDEKYVIKVMAHFGMGSTWVESSISASTVRRTIAKFESPSTTAEQKTSIINCFSSWLLVCRGSVYTDIGTIFWNLKENTIKELLIPVYRKISFITEKTSLINSQAKIFRKNLLISIQKNIPNEVWNNNPEFNFSDADFIPCQENDALNAYLDSYLDKKEISSLS